MRASLSRAVRGLTANAQLQPPIEPLYDVAPRITPSNRRKVWSDSLKSDPALQDRFYDSTVEKVPLPCYFRSKADNAQVESVVNRAPFLVAVCPPGSGSPLPAADARVWACCTL